MEERWKGVLSMHEAAGWVSGDVWRIIEAISRAWCWLVLSQCLTLSLGRRCVRGVYLLP